MIGTAREIALEMLRCSDLDGEKYVFASWNRNDIRCVCLDWDLTDEELDEVLRRLSSCLESGADIGQIRAIVETMLDERREKRTVTIPAKSLALVMQLAGREMQRIAPLISDAPQEMQEQFARQNALIAEMRVNGVPRQRQLAGTMSAGSPRASAPARKAGKAGRNDPCPCGSGQKFKKCHGVS